MNKICSACKQSLPMSHFYQKTKSSKQPYCIRCLLDYQMKRWHQTKMDALKYLGGKCVKCGYSKHWAALAFHHVDSTTKEFNWNRLRLQCLKTRLRELDKCVVLCHNCHAELHAGPLRC